MIRDYFRLLVVDLSRGKSSLQEVPGRDQYVGGSGLGAFLFQKFGYPDLPWTAPEQPLIFAIGPLTGYFPLMSKTVCAFKSPYHDQYAESHAGGRSALALRFADLDALVITGAAPRPVWLLVGERTLEIKEAPYLWGLKVQETGRLLRRLAGSSGHRSILRIGPAGENLAAMAGINVDSYRHFGRLGAGAVMGAKKLKAVVILGQAAFPLPPGKDYPQLFQQVYRRLTDDKMMEKYFNLGTPANIAILNELRALPYRNLQQTSDPAVAGISGETFADRALLRNHACSGCPVGCIHIGFVREKFRAENRYLYRQVAYDHEPLFAAGAMLGLQDCFAVLTLLDLIDDLGLDVISAGVALAWATEALARGQITLAETLVPLEFGLLEPYLQAVQHLALGSNDFYRLLAQGTAKAAAHYGGGDYACVLGQEMAGYATGEVFVVSQALGLRHSHLDAAGYVYDRHNQTTDIDAAVDFLLQDEQDRVGMTSMVACLFARSVYRPETLAECLGVLGYQDLATRLPEVSRQLQILRWRTRFATGYDPRQITIPRRFFEISNWKGPLNQEFVQGLQEAYAKRLVELAASG